MPPGGRLRDRGREQEASAHEDVERTFEERAVDRVLEHERAEDLGLSLGTATKRGSNSAATVRSTIVWKTPSDGTSTGRSAGYA